MATGRYFSRPPRGTPAFRRTASMNEFVPSLKVGRQPIELKGLMNTKRDIGLMMHASLGDILDERTIPGPTGVSVVPLSQIKTLQQAAAYAAKGFNSCLSQGKGTTGPVRVAWIAAASAYRAAATSIVVHIAADPFGDPSSEVVRLRKADELANVARSTALLPPEALAADPGATVTGGSGMDTTLIIGLAVAAGALLLLK